MIREAPGVERVKRPKRGTFTRVPCDYGPGGALATTPAGECAGDGWTVTLRAKGSKPRVCSSCTHRRGLMNGRQKREVEQERDIVVQGPVFASRWGVGPMGRS